MVNIPLLQKVLDRLDTQPLGKVYLLKEGEYCAVGFMLSVGGIPDSALDGHMCSVGLDALDESISSRIGVNGDELYFRMVGAYKVMEALYGIDAQMTYDLIDLNDALESEEARVFDLRKVLEELIAGEANV